MLPYCDIIFGTYEGKVSRAQKLCLTRIILPEEAPIRLQEFLIQSGEPPDPNVILHFSLSTLRRRM